MFYMNSIVAQAKKRYTVMMICRKSAFIALVSVPCILLAACSEKEEPKPLQVSGARSSVALMHIIAKRSVQSNRPSSMLGVFSGIYTSQGVLLSVESANAGMQSISTILEGQSNSSTNENFALLREVGETLQTDIIDTLNRSTNRTQTLDAYTQSLRNIGILTERKITELDTLNDVQKTQEKAERKAVREIERGLRSALNDKDYGKASEFEEQLATKNASYAEISTKQQQTDDMIDRFETLLEVTAERLQAVETNREILIAGLRVIDVPGIADFDILEEGKPWRKKKGSSLFDKPLQVR